MAFVRTTFVEIKTNDGRTAVLDDGWCWRCNDTLLRQLLNEKAAPDELVEDPILEAANLACYAVGGHIVHRRREPVRGPLGALYRAFRAITDNRLQQGVTNADELNLHLGSESLRLLKMNRLVAAAMWSAAAVAMLAGWVYLFA